MTTIVTASRGRVAAYHLTGLGLGAAFPVLYVWGIQPATHIPVWAKAVFLAAACVGLVLFLSAGFRILRILSTQGSWKVSVSRDRLFWETAISHPQFPLDIPLAEIAEVARIETLTEGSDKETMIETTFEIRHRDGSVRVIAQDNAGINPHRVFRVLADYDVPYRHYECDKRSRANPNK